jgi:hypothetical protein
MTVAFGGNVRRSISSGLAATEAAIFFFFIFELVLLFAFCYFVYAFLLFADTEKTAAYLPSQNRFLGATLKKNGNNTAAIL